MKPLRLFALVVAVAAVSGAAACKSKTPVGAEVQSAGDAGGGNNDAKLQAKARLKALVQQGEQLSKTLAAGGGTKAGAAAPGDGPDAAKGAPPTSPDTGAAPGAAAAPSTTEPKTTEPKTFGAAPTTTIPAQAQDGLSQAQTRGDDGLMELTGTAPVAGIDLAMADGVVSDADVARFTRQADAAEKRFHELGGLRLTDAGTDELRRQLAEIRALINDLEDDVDELDADQDRRFGIAADALQGRCEDAGGRYTNGWCQCGTEMGGRAEFMDFFECRRRVSSAPFTAISSDNSVRFQSDCRRGGGTVDRDLCRCGRDYVISVNTWNGAYYVQNDTEAFVRNCNTYTRQAAFTPGQGRGQSVAAPAQNKKCYCGPDATNTSCLVARYDAQNPNGAAVAWTRQIAGTTCGRTNAATDLCSSALRENVEQCLRR